MRHILPLVAVFGLSIVAVFGLSMGQVSLAQQSQESGQSSSGQVLNSPMPRVKIVRPDGTTSDTFSQQTSAQKETQDSEADEAEKPGELPKVVRLGGGREDEDTADKKPENADEQDDEEQTDGRFKRAPKRTARFKPDEVVSAVPLASPRTRLKNGARLRQLDKMTGLIRTYDVAVGETVRVARLRVRLDACRSPGDNDTHGTMAFLKVWDSKYDTPDPEFSGWMFAESPALSALDHPRYDLWVINCTTPLGE